MPTEPKPREVMFRLGMVGFTSALGKPASLGTIMERAHQRMENTRATLTIQRQQQPRDGIVTVRRIDAHAASFTFDRDVNRPPTSTIPEWVGDAYTHLQRLRPIATERPR